MDWKGVGSFLSNNLGKEAALVGSLLTGNIPGAIASGAALVQTATGKSTPDAAMQALQNDPQSLLKLKELAVQQEAQIQKHLETMHLADLQDKQSEQTQTQTTIRSGDNASDEYVRHTRPLMARGSFYATVAYILLAEACKIGGYGQGANWEVASVLSGPAWTYMGARGFDKWGAAKFNNTTGKGA